MNDQLPATIAGDMYSSPAMFEHMQRVAKSYAASDLVPQHIRSNLANVITTLGMARALNENPIIVMQNIYFVSGKAGWLATYLIAKINQSGILKGRLKWREEGAGATLKVTAYGIERETGEELAASADMKMAEAEGWTKNPKYKTMPAHMLRYRSATFFMRLYCPEQMLGLPAVDELEDMRFAGTLRDDGTGTLTPEPPPRPVRENYKAYELYDETGVLIETLFSPEEWKVAYEHARDRAGDVDAIVEANAATVHAIYGSAPQGGPTSPPAATEPLTAAAPATINQEGGDRHVPAANPGIVAPAGTAHPEAAQGITLVYTNGERQEYADTKEDAEAYMAALKTACEGDKRTWGLNVPTARAVAKRYGLMGSAKALNAKYGEAGA